MKKFSKLIALALACVMALTMLTACAGGGASSSSPASSSKPSSNPPASSGSTPSSASNKPASSTPASSSESTATSTDEKPVVATTQTQRSQILKLLNEARKSKGLNELEELEPLNEMASQDVGAYAVVVDEFQKRNYDASDEASAKQEKLLEQLRKNYYPTQENTTWTGTFENQVYQYAGTSWLTKYPTTANDFIAQSDGYKLKATHVGITVCTYNGKTYVEIQYAIKK